MNKNIYTKVFAVRGFHIESPENTMGAFKRAIVNHFDIELDVRMLKDGILVCFRDRYMKRLLGIPGKLSSYPFDFVRKYPVLGSKEEVPELSKVLEEVNGKVAILLNIHGYMTNQYRGNLAKVLKHYTGEVYFQCNNFFTYVRIRKMFGDTVIWSHAPMQKKLETVKGTDYKDIYYVPELDNVVIEMEDRAATAIRKIYKAFNRGSTRVGKDHFLLRYQYAIQHRGVYNTDYPEHSLKGFEECILNNKVIELDVAEYNGKMVCYHDDSIATKLGQEVCIAEKVGIDQSLLFEDVITFIAGRVPIVIDIKDFHLFSRKMEDKILEILKDYQGEFVFVTFNPLVNIYLKNNHPEIIRGQICNSLSGFKRNPRLILKIVNFILSYEGDPDFFFYDLDPSVFILAHYVRNTGKPVLLYTLTSMGQKNQYHQICDNMIVEGNFVDKN